MEYITLVLTSISALVVPFFLWFLNTRTNKRIEEIKRVDERKIETYKRLFEIYNSILSQNKKIIWNTKNRVDLVVDLLKYAPDEIIDSYVRFWSRAKEYDLSNIDLSPLYREMLILIRKDLGYKNTKVNGSDIITLLLSE